MSQRSFRELVTMTPEEFRAIVRRGEWTEKTMDYTEEYAGWEMAVCRGYTQSNLAVVPQDMAFEFLLFCQRNPRPCALLEVTDAGDPHPRRMAPEADLRTDLPRYRVFQEGELIDEPTDISRYWRDDLVAFLIGDSTAFDWAMVFAGVKFRLLGAYVSHIPCVPAGPFRGPMAVTGRRFQTSQDAVRAIQISSRHLYVHGPPVHIGDAREIGIEDLNQSAFTRWADIPPRQPGEIDMFWGCGCTPQTILEARPSLVITHKPAHMFVTDRLVEEVAVL